MKNTTKDFENMFGNAEINQRTAKYHGGFDKLDRIHQLCWALDQLKVRDASNRSMHDFISGHKYNVAILEAMYQELVGKLTDDERTEYKEKLKEINSELAAMSYNSRFRGMGGMPMNNEVGPLLFELEERMRIKIDKIGYGVPLKADALEAADND